MVDHTVEDKGPLGHLLTQRLPPIDVTPEEAKQLGYMPFRNVFEREYDPTAEQLVSSLSLNQDDDDIDLILKLAQVDIYTRRLRERTRRKRIVRDFQLIMNFFRGSNLMNARRRQSKEQREFRDRFRVFAQFYTAYEFDRRLNSFEREKALRIRLSELSRYRWNGLTRIDECIHFEQHAAAAQARNTGPFGQYGKTVSIFSLTDIQVIFCYCCCCCSVFVFILVFGLSYFLYLLKFHFTFIENLVWNESMKLSMRFFFRAKQSRIVNSTTSLRT